MLLASRRQAEAWKAAAVRAGTPQACGRRWSGSALCHVPQLRGPWCWAWPPSLVREGAGCTRQGSPGIIGWIDRDLSRKRPVVRVCSQECGLGSWRVRRVPARWEALASWGWRCGPQSTPESQAAGQKTGSQLRGRQRGEPPPSVRAARRGPGLTEPHLGEALCFAPSPAHMLLSSRSTPDAQKSGVTSSPGLPWLSQVGGHSRLSQRQTL